MERDKGLKYMQNNLNKIELCTFITDCLKQQQQVVVNFVDIFTKVLCATFMF